MCHIVRLEGIRIWNYNGGVEMSYAGVRHARVSLDGGAVALRAPPVLLRRAPGHVCYDFVHQIDMPAIDDRYVLLKTRVCCQ